uniref:Si:ch211-13k12.2 n=1 Tax=Amphilophus citrinellus TaxID=61819 RepID=A0A3Q0T740_AMPCI
MAALRQEHRYGLSCAKINKNTPNQTLFHVKLTDTAIRTLEAYQNLKASLSNQPAICFKGSQGYIKIPAPTPESPDGFRVFSFYLSSDSKDKPQSSFDCIHQYVSKCVKVQRKQGLVSSSDINNKHSPNNKRSLVPSPVAHRPLRDRIIHLLALKPYRKPELLLWLDRERATPKDKVDLTSVLEEFQVAKLSPKDHSYSLKDELYRHVQRDWPGYLEEEKQLIHRLLIKLQPLHSSQLKSPQSSHSFHKTPGDSPSQHSPAKNLSKRPLALDPSNIQTPKRQRLSDKCQPLQSPSHADFGTNGARSSSSHGNSSGHIKTEFDKTNNHLQGSPNGLYSPHKLSRSSTLPKAERTEAAPTAPSPKPPHSETSMCNDQQFTNGQHKKKRSKKHKDKERERLKADWIETSPDLKQNQENLKHEGQKTPVNCATAEELPDYLKYSTITALEQRQQYNQDFCAEYDEYRALHDRIGAITEMFVQLGSKINTLSPGTQEYKFPGYREEKKRCEYLHKKLSHIKGLITEYDRAQGLS